MYFAEKEKTKNKKTDFNIYMYTLLVNYKDNYSVAVSCCQRIVKRGSNEQRLLLLLLFCKYQTAVNLKKLMAQISIFPNK